MANFFWTLENPPNFSLPAELRSQEKFLEHLNISAAELKNIWWFSHRMYTQFEIPKRSGGTRAIFAPNNRLKYLQGKLRHLLEKIYKARHAVHGFVKDRSVKTNAQEHVGRHHLLNLDLENFFPSISEKRVTGLFLSLGMDTETAETAARIACLRGRLPQGSPASPIISNMICYRMDRELMRFCKERRIRYSRYADDITLSMYSRPNLMIVGGPLLAGSLKSDALDPALRAIIANNGFTINENKVRYSDKNSRQKVTGCIVNEFVNVPRTYVREVRAMLYSVEKSGIANAQEKFTNNSHSTGHIENVLRGKIAWLGQIKGKSDPIFRKFASRYNAIFTSTMIKVEATAQEKEERSVWIVEYCYDKNGEVQIEQGTAFFLEDAGFVTAFHCVDGGEDIEVFHPSKPANRFPVKLKKGCAARDLAILEHEVPPEEHYTLAVAEATPNEDNAIVALGYPSYGPGDKISRRPGQIHSRPIKSGVRYLEVSMKLNQGMSGGPILNAVGNVIGVTHKGGKTEDKDLAVDIKELLEFF